MTREDIIRRGESAKRLLGDDTAVAAWVAVQEKCAEAWADSAPHQQEIRDDAYRLSRCIKLVKLQLETWAGEAAAEVHNGDRKLNLVRDAANV